MADGFLGRWARRKQEVREGRPLQEPLMPSPQPSPAGGRGGASAPLAPSADGQEPILKEGEPVSHPLPPAGKGRGEGAVNDPLPTLDDVQALTPQSDFKPFVARGVDPAVKNAAMKKLFADPHFNVMDRLDIYIDDYGKPDPLPASMLRQMASAQFLKLFDDEKGDNPPPSKPIVPPPDTQSADPTPQAAPVPAGNPEPTPENHANTDLRLQPNHAAGAPGSGGGAQ